MNHALHPGTALAVVHVQHESAKPGSLFHPDSPDHAFKSCLDPVTPDLVVTKTVHSSFHGTPDLHEESATVVSTRQVLEGLGVRSRP